MRSAPGVSGGGMRNGWILDNKVKAELIDLDASYERKRSVKDNSKIFVLRAARRMQLSAVSMRLSVSLSLGTLTLKCLSGLQAEDPSR